MNQSYRKGWKDYQNVQDAVNDGIVSYSAPEKIGLVKTIFGGIFFAGTVMIYLQLFTIIGESFVK